MDDGRAVKPAPQWTIRDIETYADSEEGSYLEFKKANEFLTNGKYDRNKMVTELVETASAFLNADATMNQCPEQAKCKTKVRHPVAS